MTACRRTCADPVCLTAGCRGAACAGSCADPVCEGGASCWDYLRVQAEYYSRRDRWCVANPEATAPEREAALGRICRELGL